jgi:hypothetical protein
VDDNMDLTEEDIAAFEAEHEAFHRAFRDEMNAKLPELAKHLSEAPVHIDTAVELYIDRMGWRPVDAVDVLPEHRATANALKLFASWLRGNYAYTPSDTPTPHASVAGHFGTTVLRPQG